MSTTSASRTDPADSAYTADLAAVAALLKRTENIFDPAVRTENERRKATSLAGASIKLNFGVMFLLALSISVNGLLGWVALHPDNKYFATEHGRITPLVGLDRPYRTPADVIQTARDTVTKSFTLDFGHWQGELEDVRPRYDRNGFKSFLAALAGSGILEQVKAKRMDVTATTGTGVLAKDGIEDGEFVWYVEMPLELKLNGQTTDMPAQRFKATVRVVRIPTLDNVEGIAVGQLITTPN